MIRAAIVTAPIDIDSVTREVASRSSGATAIFIGTVREHNKGREVSGIEYSAYDEMAVKEITAILAEASEKFALENAVAIHRIGELAIGDASIAVAVAHAHRGNAIDAMRYIVEETKMRAPIWKLEHYLDGTREWVNAGTETPR
jgi:molybdopterin synthase catalytic subunit